MRARGLSWQNQLGGDAASELVNSRDTNRAEGVITGQSAGLLF